jgi:hypothetical protein
VTYRSPQRLLPTATPKRLFYLRQCERLGPYEPRHGVTANHCLRLGWVETAVERRGGETVAFRDLSDIERLSGSYRVLGQRLTPAGTAVLDRKMPSRSRG